MLNALRHLRMERVAAQLPLLMVLASAQRLAASADGTQVAPGIFERFDSCVLNALRHLRMERT